MPAASKGNLQSQKNTGRKHWLLEYRNIAVLSVSDLLSSMDSNNSSWRSIANDGVGSRL